MLLAAAQEREDLVVEQLVHEGGKRREDEGHAVLFHVGDVAHVLVSDDVLQRGGKRHHVFHRSRLGLVYREENPLSLGEFFETRLDGFA